MTSEQTRGAESSGRSSRFAGGPDPGAGMHVAGGGGLSSLSPARGSLVARGALRACGGAPRRSKTGAGDGQPRSDFDQRRSDPKQARWRVLAGWLPRAHT